MITENHITSSCVISNNAVRKNGKVVFTNDSADVAGFLTSIYKWLDTGYARFYKMDSLSKLGWLASEILLKTDFIKDQYQAEEIGIVLANANSSLDTDIKYEASIQDIPSPSVFVYTLPNIMTGEICIRNHFKGENAFFITEEFNAVFMQQYVNNLLDNGILQTCICGWVELLENDYKVALYLVEKNREGIFFSTAHMNAIFHSENPGNE